MEKTVLDDDTTILDMPPCPFEDFLNSMEENGAGRWVWSYMEFCARLGVLHAEPGRFILARPVNSEIPMDDLACFADIDPERYANRELTEAHDAWHIVYASGGIEDFFSLSPYELPKLIWQRDNGRVRIYDYQKIKSKIHGKLPKTSKSVRPCNNCHLSE